MVDVLPVSVARSFSSPGRSRSNRNPSIRLESHDEAPFEERAEEVQLQEEAVLAHVVTSLPPEP